MAGAVARLVLGVGALAARRCDQSEAPLGAKTDPRLGVGPHRADAAEVYGETMKWSVRRPSTFTAYPVNRWGPATR